MQHSVGSFARLTDARAALAVAQGEKARGTFIPPTIRRRRAREQREYAQQQAAADQFTVADLFAEWHVWLGRAGRKPSTLDQHAYRYSRYIAPTFADRPVSTVTPADVDAWHEAITEENGKGAARTAYMTLSSMFTYATGRARGQRPPERPYATANPCQVPGASVHTPVRKPGRSVATADEMQAIADLMPPGSGMAVLLAGWCGLRLGEVMALRRRHITEHDGMMWLHVETQLQRDRDGVLYETTPKSWAGTRTVPVPPIITAALHQHIDDDAGHGRNGLLFPRRRRGVDYGAPETLESRFSKARQRFNDAQIQAGEEPLDGFTFHHLRHTALTRLGEAGATLEELRVFAGHRNYDHVARYQHATRDRLAMLADKMGGTA
ncbi:tyrosine-type recombinase/integrase [Micrococcus lylae]|uniref:tyrosine-type recombinase/integrase n=1 Tax=Micrococcus lylae TaxID=1273 RepID=UPI003EB8FC7C